MVVDLLDWLAIFRDTETGQRVKVRVEAGNSVAAINAAMHALDEARFCRSPWMVMESCESLELGGPDA